MASAERCRIGVQLWPQATTVAELRRAAVAAEDAGVDSVWVWDHFYPLRGDPDAAHFESWTLLSAIAVETSRVQLGHLVGCATYRNPHLVADMARTVDHLSDGRFVLGLGAGWSRRDHEEYEYPYGTPGTRVRDLDGYLFRVRQRLDRLTPPPLGELPLLVGGMGEEVTLRLVATHADVWNGTGDPDGFRQRSRVLDRWCERIDRDPATIVRSCHIALEAWDRVDDYVDAGAAHLMIQCPPPFDLEPARRMLDAVGA